MVVQRPRRNSKYLSLTNSLLILSIFPVKNSSGTGFCCGGGHNGTSTNDAGYGVYMVAEQDLRQLFWYVHMWGHGYENIKGGSCCLP